MHFAVVGMKKSLFEAKGGAATYCNWLGTEGPKKAKKKKKKHVFYKKGQNLAILTVQE